eukprot:Seg762.1 transcript_id=Seg762.1/GoldUCD/mRNA.D3Y31 product="hypothetical protein" protein_id=Seg762.1/GoldUCD/D3Y31
MAREIKAGDKVTCVVEQQLPNCLIVRFQSGKGKNKARIFRGVLIDEKCSATKRAIQRKEPSQKPTLTKEATSSFIETFNSKNVSGKFLRNKKKPSCLVLDDFYIDYHHDGDSNSSTESSASLEYNNQFYITKRRRKQITKSDLEIVLPSKDQPENEQLVGKKEKREQISKKQGKQMQNSQKEDDTSDKTEVNSNSSSEDVLKEKNESQELGLVATEDSAENSEFAVNCPEEEETVLTCSEDSVKHMEENINSEGYFSSTDKTASFPDSEDYLQVDSEKHNDLLQSPKIDEGSVIISEELAECMVTSIRDEMQGIEKEIDDMTDSQETICSEPKAEIDADGSSSAKAEEKPAPGSKKEVKKKKTRKPKNAIKSKSESRENKMGDAVKSEEFELRKPLNFFGESLLESCENGNSSEDNIPEVQPERQVLDDSKSTRTRKPSKRKLEAFEADAYLRGAKKRKSIKVQKYVEENAEEGGIVDKTMEYESVVGEEKGLAVQETASNASLEVNGALSNDADRYTRDVSDIVVQVMQEEMPVTTKTALVISNEEDMSRVTMIRELGGVAETSADLGEESENCSRIMTSPRKRLSPKKIVTVQKKTPVKKKSGSRKSAKEGKLPSLENIVKQKVGLSRMSASSLENEMQKNIDSIASKSGDEEALPNLESTLQQRIVTEDMLFCKEPAVSGQLCRDLSARERYLAKWSVMKQAQKLLNGKIKLLDATEIAPFEEAARQREILATVRHNERSRGMTHKGKRYVLVNLKEAGVFDNITPGPGRRTVKIEVSATKNLRVPKNSANKDVNASNQGAPEQNATVFKERVVAKVLGGAPRNIGKETDGASTSAASGVEEVAQSRPLSLEQRQQVKSRLSVIPAKPWKDIDPTQLQQVKSSLPVVPAKPWKDIDPTQKLWKIGKKMFKALPVYIVPKKGNKKKVEGQVNADTTVLEAVSNNSTPPVVGEKDEEAVDTKPTVTVPDEASVTQEVQRVKYYDEYTINSPKKSKKKSPESGNTETKNLKGGTAGEGKKRQRPNKGIIKEHSGSNERKTGGSMSHKAAPGSLPQNASNAFHEDEMRTESFGNLSAARLCENIGEELAQSWSELDPNTTDPGETNLEFESNVRLTESESMIYDDDSDNYIDESSSSDTDQMVEFGNQGPFSDMERCSQAFEQLNEEENSRERGNNSIYAQMSFQRLVASAHAEALRGNVENDHKIRQGEDGAQGSLVSPVFPASKALREILEASRSGRRLENDTVQEEDDPCEKSSDQSRNKSIGCKKIQNKDSLLMQALLNSHEHSMHRNEDATGSQQVLAASFPPKKSLSSVVQGLFGASDHLKDDVYDNKERDRTSVHGRRDTALLTALSSIEEDGIKQRADSSSTDNEIPSSSRKGSLALKIALKNITRSTKDPQKPSSGVEGSHDSSLSYGVHKSPHKQNKKGKGNLFKAKNISPERSSREAISGLANMERRLQGMQVKENGEAYTKGVQSTSSTQTSGNIKNLQRDPGSLQTKGSLNREDNRRRRKSGKPKKCLAEQGQHFGASSKNFFSVDQNEIKKEIEDDADVYTVLENREQVFMESAMSERDYQDLIEQSGMDPMYSADFSNELLKGLHQEISPRSTSPHAKILAYKNIPNEFVKAKLLQFEFQKHVGSSEKATHEEFSTSCPENGKEVLIRVSNSKGKKLKLKGGTKYSRIGRRRYPTQHKGLRRRGSSQDLSSLGGSSLAGQSASAARLVDSVPCMVPIRDLNLNTEGGERVDEVLELSCKKNNRAREQGEELLKEMFTLNKEILSKSEPNFVVVDTNTTR